MTRLVGAHLHLERHESSGVLQLTASRGNVHAAIGLPSTVVYSRQAHEALEAALDLLDVELDRAEREADSSSSSTQCPYGSTLDALYRLRWPE